MSSLLLYFIVFKIAIRANFLKVLFFKESIVNVVSVNYECGIFREMYTLK